MKREILILCCCLFTVLFTGCKDKDVVYVRKAGTLATLIPAAKKYELRTLKLAGKLNGSDIRFIREMAGCDIYDNKTSGKLAVLDLSKANIVEGGDADYYAVLYKKMLKTSNNSIGMLMFYACERLTSVILPNNITSIEENAFFDTRLTSITIPESVTFINNYAFNSTRLEEIYSANSVPPKCLSASFNGVNQASCTLYVPVGSLEAYKNANEWEDFKNIVEKVTP